MKPETESNIASSQPDCSQYCISLTQLASGDRARFHQADLCCEDCEMLNAMGMTDRCEFKVCKSGGPWILQVKSTRIGLSRTMAQKIFVIPSATA